MPRNLLVSHYALPSPSGRIGVRTKLSSIEKMGNIEFDQVARLTDVGVLYCPMG